MYNEPRLSIESFPEIIVTHWDLGRLDNLLSYHTAMQSSRVSQFLLRKLMAAKIVNETEISAVTVTIGSRVECHDEDGGTPRVVTIVHPNDLDSCDDAVSILSPVGATLFGLSEGQSMTYAMPGGRLKNITVEKVLYQPEASRRSCAPTHS